METERSRGTGRGQPPHGAGPTVQLDVPHVLEKVHLRVGVRKVRCHVDEPWVGGVGLHQRGEEGNGFVVGKLKEGGVRRRREEGGVRKGKCRE